MSLSSRILYKCKQVACSVVIACLLVYTLFYYLLLNKSAFFILTELLYFCVFVDHVIKPIFGVFVYHFENTISIVVAVV